MFNMYGDNILIQCVGSEEIGALNRKHILYETLQSGVIADVGANVEGLYVGQSVIFKNQKDYSFHNEGYGYWIVKPRDILAVIKPLKNKYEIKINSKKTKKFDYDVAEVILKRGIVEISLVEHELYYAEWIQQELKMEHDNAPIGIIESVVDHVINKISECEGWDLRNCLDNKNRYIGR